MLDTPQKKPTTQRKLSKENDSKGSPHQSTNDKTAQSDSETFDGDQRSQVYQNYDIKSKNLWSIDDSLKKGRRIIDRRQKFIKKQRAALEKDLNSSKKAEEAINLLKQQIEYKYDMVSESLMKLKQRQNSDIMAMKDQVRCLKLELIV